MASLGHIAVGIAAARVTAGERTTWREYVGWSTLSMLPDADVVGFSLGVRYADEWGHRGATHSFAFAAIVGLAIGAIARSRGAPFRRTAVLAVAVLATHPLLDTLTDGGLGCALFWPFDLTRYFAPWRPIPVAPIGLYFFSPSGPFVSVVEVALFAPLFVFALRRTRMRAPIAHGSPPSAATNSSIAASPRTMPRIGWAGPTTRPGSTAGARRSLAIASASSASRDHGSSSSARAGRQNRRGNLEP